MRMARWSLIFAGLHLSSGAVAGRCSDLWAKVLGIEDRVEVSEHELRLRQVFDEMVEERFAELNEAEQARLLGAIENIAYLKGHDEFNVSVPSLSVLFPEEAQRTFTSLGMVFHEHFHVYDYLRLRGSAPFYHRWLHRLEVSSRGMEIRAYLALYDFYRRLKRYPDYVQMITSAAQRDFDLNDAEAALYAEILTGLNTKHHFNPATESLEGLSPEQSKIWRALFLNRPPTVRLVLGNYVRGLGLDELTYVGVCLESYRERFDEERVDLVVRFIQKAVWAVQSVWPRGGK